MNIFKVFASSKKGFQEEYASAILAWLLNPAMEHGLGHAFLSEFLTEAGKAEGAPDEIGALAASLRTHLRHDSPGFAACETFLELNVEQAFIDVVVNIDVREHRWAIVIENKIFSTSACDPSQLMREYIGIRETKEERFKDRRILMVFLVPTHGGGLHTSVVKEWANLQTEPRDGKILMTWDQGAGGPSVSRAIGTLLSREGAGDIEPLQEGTRHTLKALRRFVEDGFVGYPFEQHPAPGGLNVNTELTLTYNELQLRADGWVGVQHGIGGLLRIMVEVGGLAAYTRPFQFTTQDMKNARYWMLLSTFKTVARLDRVNDSTDLGWMDSGLDGPIPASLIHFVAARAGTQFFVGIDGGAPTLQAMDANIIVQKRWGVSTMQKSPQWIPSETFEAICAAKGVIWPKKTATGSDPAP